jgi:lipopolysaccharide assembly outer membrane protein LptD (OstA)
MNDQHPPARTVLVAAAAMLALAAAAPGAPTNAGFHNIGGFDTITTKTIDTNLNTGDFTVPEHFDATRGGTEISADRATGNSKRKLVHATGHVVVHRTGPLSGQGDLSNKYSGEPSTLTCDSLDVDGTRKYYVATGNVRFTQAEREATADRGTLNDVTNELHLVGNVHIRDKEQYLDGTDVVYNTRTGDVKASGNPVIVRTPTETPGPAAPSAGGTAKPKRRIP